jgi:hypothetical protein
MNKMTRFSEVTVSGAGSLWVAHVFTSIVPKLKFSVYKGKLGQQLLQMGHSEGLDKQVL